MTSTRFLSLLLALGLATVLGGAGCGGDDDDDDSADGDADSDADSDSDSDADSDGDADSDSDGDADGDADGDGDGDGDGDADPNAPRIHLQILTETIGAGDDIDVAVEAENFTLEEPVGQPNADGHGHYHIYLDDDTGGDYLVAGAAAENIVGLPRNLAAGVHTLRANLSDNGHLPLNPAIEDVVEFTVE